MKKHLFISLAIIAVIIIVPLIAYAYGNVFGGRINAVGSVGISCDTAGSPIYIMPSTGPTGPYVLDGEIASEGDWILGFYHTQMGPCHTGEGDERIDVTTYVIDNRHGVSR
jgi:hypothetical protein